MVPFAQRLRIENSEKPTAHLHTAAILFARSDRYTGDSHVDRHRSGAMSEIRIAWPAQLPIGHTIHLLGAICESTLISGPHHSVCTFGRFHSRWCFAVVVLGGRAYRVQCHCHTHSIARCHGIPGNQSVRHSSRNYGIERWSICVLHRSHINGECWSLLIFIIIIIIISHVRPFDMLLILYYVLNLYKNNNNNKNIVTIIIKCISMFLSLSLSSSFHSVFLPSILLCTGFHHIGRQAWSTCAISIAKCFRARHPWHSHIVAGRTHAIYIAVWIYRAAFLLATICRYDYRRRQRLILLSHSAQFDRTECWTGSICTWRTHIHTITANLSQETTAQEQRSQWQRSPVQLFVAVTI